jgi:hypothetical protein
MAKLTILSPSSGSGIDGVEIALTPMEASSLARRLIKNVNEMKEVDMIFETSNKKCIIIQTVKE